MKQSNTKNISNKMLQWVRELSQSERFWPMVAVTWLAVIITTAAVASILRRRRRKSDAPEIAKCLKRIPHPPGDVFTLETLKEWDGINARMYVSVCGIVYDVSSSENFVPTMGYGKLWGGSDCTYALCKMLLDPELTNRVDFKIDDLKPLEKKSLQGWREHFKKKYERVGTVAEFADFDFSELDNLPETDEENNGDANQPREQEDCVAEGDTVPDFGDVE